MCPINPFLIGCDPDSLCLVWGLVTFDSYKSEAASPVSGLRPLGASWCVLTGDFCPLALAGNLRFTLQHSPLPFLPLHHPQILNMVLLP